ncbi:hypothetical protein D3C81_1903760 [compost metagenome]
MLMFFTPRIPATEAVLTIAPPPWAAINGSWYFMHSHTPLTLTFMIASNSLSSKVGRRSFLPSMPALFTA